MSNQVVNLVKRLPRGLLSSTQKFVLWALADRANDEGRDIYPTKDTIANLVEVDQKTVKRIVNKLRELGYIGVQTDPPKSWYALRPDKRRPCYYIDVDKLSVLVSIHDDEQRGDIICPPARPPENTDERRSAAISPPRGDIEIHRGDICAGHGGTNGAERGDIICPPRPPKETSEETKEIETSRAREATGGQALSPREDGAREETGIGPTVNRKEPEPAASEHSEKITIFKELVRIGIPDGDALQLIKNNSVHDLSERLRIEQRRAALKAPGLGDDTRDRKSMATGS